MPRNGDIPLGSMVIVEHFAPLYLGVNHDIGSDRLMPVTAGKIATLQRAYQDAFHKPMSLAECYRPLVRQNATWQLSHAGGPVAAEPGTSPHGDGIAADVREPAGQFGTPEHAWLVANCERFGLRLSVKSEAWHLVDINPGTALAGTGTTHEIEDDEMTENDWQRLSNLIDARTMEQIQNQLAGNGFQVAVTRVLPEALSAALDKVTTPYATAAGTFRTSLRDWFKDVRNALYPVKK